MEEEEKKEDEGEGSLSGANIPSTSVVNDYLHFTLGLLLAELM